MKTIKYICGHEEQVNETKMAVIKAIQASLRKRKCRDCLFKEADFSVPRNYDIEEEEL